MSFANRLKEERKRKKISQIELGKLFNLSKQTISSYENGGSFPNQETLNKFADYFNVSIDYLLGRTNLRKPTKDTYTGQELAKLVPEEYREAFLKLNIKQLKFIKKMADNDIDPEILLETMEKINEYYNKFQNKDEKK